MVKNPWFPAPSTTQQVEEEVVVVVVVAVGEEERGLSVLRLDSTVVALVGVGTVIQLPCVAGSLGVSHNSPFHDPCGPYLSAVFNGNTWATIWVPFTPPASVVVVARVRVDRGAVGWPVFCIDNNVDFSLCS